MHPLAEGGHSRQECCRRRASVRQQRRCGQWAGGHRKQGTNPDPSGGSGAGSAADGGQVSARQGLLSKGSGGSDAGGAGVGGGRLLVAVQRAAEKEYRVRRAPAVLAVRPCSSCCFPTCHCWLPGHQVS